MNPIEWAEANFACRPGEPKAFFEIPQVDGDPIRVYYVMYAARAKSHEALNEWLLDRVLKPLKESGGYHLYWRYSDRIEYESSGDRKYAYMRIAVLNKSLHPVIFKDLVKEEGRKVKELDGE